MTEADMAPSSDEKQVALSEEALIEKEFGVPLETLYRMGVKYYRDHEKEGNLLVSYEERTKFMALSKQVHFGAYDDSHNDTGWFDFVGNDRTKAWKELGDLSRNGAMASFVFLLDRVCPPFKQFVQEQLQPLPRLEERVGISNGGDREMRGQPIPAIDWQLVDAQRKQIQEALNAQTYHQFLAYAQEQLPAQPQQQELLIRQLQEQHYQQYMAQVPPIQFIQGFTSSSKQSTQGLMGAEENLLPRIVDQNSRVEVVDEEEQKKKDDDSDVSDEEPGDDLPSNPAIAPASLWNRNDIQQFKDNIKKEGSEGIIKVGHGETVTIRVPTHEDGSCLFWEFATDHYDIGFGVLFEWSISETTHVSVHISESSDEEEEALEGTEEAARPVSTVPGDVEGGDPQKERKRDANKPQQDEIIPVYRRDCHEEVYAGSHQYPGRGVYLLKFDNSYSLWRSKTLYYRVYYSK